MPVAQRIRALRYERSGWGFESLQAYHNTPVRMVMRHESSKLVGTVRFCPGVPNTPVAQWIEHYPAKVEVVGSTPTRRAIAPQGAIFICGAKMKDTITFDDFLKLDIRVGQIVSAEPVPKSKKLLKLQVDFGTEIGTRTILAGIAGPDPLGRSDSLNLEKPKVLAVVNLAPRMMMGIESHGMLLASHDDLDIVWLTSVNGVVPNGSEVS